MTREDLINANVTLNGKPAKIVGKLCAFARVVSLDGLMEGEWSWDAAERIVKKGGRFTSPNHDRVICHRCDEKRSIKEVSVDDVIREFERLNFIHVNDTKEPVGQLTEVYSRAVVEMAKRLKDLDPTWTPTPNSDDN